MWMFFVFSLDKYGYFVFDLRESVMYMKSGGGGWFEDSCYFIDLFWFGEYNRVGILGRVLFFLYRVIYRGRWVGFV